MPRVSQPLSIALLLRETGGRIGKTAQRAGVNERSLFELMRRHRLRKEDSRARRTRGV